MENNKSKNTDLKKEQRKRNNDIDIFRSANSPLKKKIIQMGKDNLPLLGTTPI